MARLAPLGLLVLSPSQIKDVMKQDSKAKPGTSGLAATLEKHPAGFIQLLEPELLPRNRVIVDATINILCVHSDPAEVNLIADRVTQAMVGGFLDNTFRFAGQRTEEDPLGAFVELAFNTVYTTQPSEEQKWPLT